MSKGTWLSGGKIRAVGFLALVAWGGAHWYNVHQAQVRRDAEVKAAESAKAVRARAALSRLKSSWNADDSWDVYLDSSKSSSPAYSYEVEQLLVKDHPIVIVGIVEDVARKGNGGTFTVRLQNHPIHSPVDVRFSLDATPELAKAIIADTHSDSEGPYQTFICVARIERVEKLQDPLEKDGDGGDYFLAHGKLLEVFDTGMFDASPDDFLTK